MSLDHTPPEPTLDQLADEFAADIGKAIDRYVRHQHPGEFGGWPGVAQRRDNRRLRDAVAMRLIASTNERLRNLMATCLRADERIHACMVNCTDGKTMAAEGAVDDFEAACTEEIETLRGELPIGFSGYSMEDEA